MINKINAQFLDIVDYEVGLKLMNELREQRLANQTPDQLLFLQHPPVITMGRRNASEDFLLSSEEIKKHGVDLVHTDRGGKLTYHGPGQLVVYFIFNIAARKLSIHRLVWLAEEGLRLLLVEHGITASRNKENPGLWIENKKIASLGFHVHKGITTHGVALNISNDLTPFQFMIPCGVAHAQTTNMLIEKNISGNIDEISKQLFKIYQGLFQPH